MKKLKRILLIFLGVLLAIVLHLINTGLSDPSDADGKISINSEDSNWVIVEEPSEEPPDHEWVIVEETPE